MLHHVTRRFATLAGMSAMLLFAPAISAQKPEIIPQEEIENTYRAKKQGEHLYRRGAYDEALPYLLFAAQRGFKRPQALVGQIYVQGLGGVEKDIAQGVGWLGAAASGKTDSEIRKAYQNVWEQVPEQHHATLNDVIEQFKQRYDGSALGVSCDLQPRAGTNTRDLRCRFRDEVHYPYLQIDI